MAPDLGTRVGGVAGGTALGFNKARKMVYGDKKKEG